MARLWGAVTVVVAWCMAAVVHGSSSSAPGHRARGLNIVRNVMRGAHRRDKDAPLTPAGFEELAHLRQELFCRDSQRVEAVGHLIPLGNSLGVSMGENTSMLKIHPMPVYITVYSTGKDIVSGSLLASGAWESRELQELLWALNTPLPPGSAITSTTSPALFVDIGANVGMFMLNVAAWGYEVIAFEAMPANQRLLRTSMCASAPAAMSHVTLHAFGLGNQRSTCYLLADWNWGNGVPVCGAKDEADAVRIYGDPTYSVRDTMEIERLDDVLQRDIKAMKIDVEGFEPMVLEGAIKLLEEHTVWFMLLEFNKMRLVSSLRGTNISPVHHAMQLNGKYRISRTSFQGPFVTNDNLLAMAAHEEFSNLFFVHNRFPG